MSTNSAIEWTDCTWNPVSGCTRVSAGCDNCYATKMTYRLEKMGQSKYAGLTVLNGKGDRHFNGKVLTHEDALTIPLSWQRGAKAWAKKHGRPRRVFVNSMSDLFHKDVPYEFVDKVFAVMALCPDVVFQILTKRPERMAEYFAGMDAQNLGVDDGDVTGTDIAHRLSVAAGCLLDGQWIWNKGKTYRKAIEGFISDCIGELDGFDEDEPDRKFNRIMWPLPNVWIGTSVENQEAADERIPHLLRCPAAVRFLSCEPLLGPVRIDEILVPFGDEEHEKAVICPLTGEWVPPEPSPVGGGVLHWIIVGGESGPRARPLNVEWIRSIVAQCRAADVAVFVKQLGLDPFEAGDCAVLSGGMGRHHAVYDAGGPRNGESFWGLKLSDRKGGNIDEWPVDLCIRQFPQSLTGASR